ncbi:MAG TPA: hypothetical protein VE969_03825 [Pyrinomonadaceae bacterium]|nr:hypothetical protein [Pyrinomonadaceae bacterium]
MKRTFLVVFALLVIACAGLVMSANAQKARPANTGEPVAQQPLYGDYRGVRLGMTPQEVRAKLGNPVLKDEELDYFVFADNVTAQVAYDGAHKAKAISVDFPGGVGAPDYKAVVGTELTTRPDGSMFKLVRYESLGFWVSYNRTAGPTVVVTITIQRILG